MSESEAMVDEFDTVARWTALAVEELGEDHALPAACRGSGSPDALRWLANALDLSPGASLLDVGAGLGGPAEAAARAYDVRPVLVEPMVGACLAARRLFAWPTAAADGSALPFADGSFDAVWSLGVLCTLEDKLAVLREIVRVLVPGGVVGLLVYLRTVESLPEQPDGNHFPTEEELDGLVADAGLEVVDSAMLADFASASPEWKAAESRVEDVVERDHAHDERWQRAQDQQDTIVGLIEDGLVTGRLIVCRAASCA
jgi:SAM-dependent methyltransferase